MSDFKDLVVWQKAHALALNTYESTRTFPQSEQFGLVEQMRRAAASISANIAESSGRHGQRDQTRLLRVALASARELEAHLLLSRDLGMLPGNTFAAHSAQLLEVQKMLSGLIGYRVRRTRADR